MDGDLEGLGEGLQSLR